MIAPAQTVIKAVVDTLKNQVLPELEVASWTAANVRASMMLLTYIEDRLTLEPPSVLQDIEAMRKLLGSACADIYAPLLEDRLRGEIAALVHPAQPAPPSATTSDQFQESLVYKELLTKTINQAHRNQAADPARYADLRTSIDAFLAVMHQHEYDVIARSEKLDAC